jgi:multidrug transporter EmrE-like cation transporter
VAFNQKIDLSAVIGIGLIIIGVVVLRVFSDAGVD